MNFQELLDAQRTGQLAGLPEDWGQGRTLFGGMMAALLLDAMRQQVPAERCLRALSISFIAPAALGQGMQVEVELLREGRAVSQLLARASQDGQVVALMQGSFGASRLSQVQVAALPAPSFKTAEVCQRMPWLPGITPNFTQHFDMRWAVGGLPFSGNLSREMGGWVSFADAQLADQRLDECHLLGLVDAWPPALLDLRPGDVLIVFDIRRYESTILQLAELAVERGAEIVLITDPWVSPIAAHARFRFSAQIEVPSAWDSSVALLVLVETLLAAVQERDWPQTEARMRRHEDLYDRASLFRRGGGGAGGGRRGGAD